MTVRRVRSSAPGADTAVQILFRDPGKRMKLVRDLSVLLWTTLAACLMSAAIPSAAAAQGYDGFDGWQSPHTSLRFPSADAACRAQWKYYNGAPKSRYIGVKTTGNPNIPYCSWTQYQYLCPAETGGGINTCGTIFPTNVSLKCASGYTALRGECRKDPVPERPCPTCKHGPSENPKVGNPVVVSTGAKLQHATDYEASDGQFVIGRSYRSFPVGKSTSYETPIVGLAGGWAFDFMPELQLAAYSGTVTSPNVKLAIVMPDGTAYDFKMASGGALVADTATGAVYASTELKLEYVGTLPASLADLGTASSQWRLTDGSDTVWTFQTFPRPNASAYEVGRPASRVTRDGYQWTYAYRPDNSLQTVTDSFGRTATFTWSTYFVSSLASPPAGSLPYPEAVASVTLPDGTSIRYSYDPPPVAVGPSTGKAERLVKAERLDASSAVVDATSYSYDDIRFPRHLTKVADMNGAEVASYAYDGRGRGTTTTLAGGKNGYTLSYAEAPTEFVQTVTNPLGKNEDYHFTKFGTGALDVRLTSVSGQASANTLAATRSTTYGADRFIATRTDEEGRVTSYTRDTRGRPTAIVEALGTPQQRTTTISWHPTLNLPSQEVRPGLQVDYTYSSGGQLLTRTETDTTTHSVPYSTNGQARTWTYTWGTGGRLASVNGPKPVDALGKDDTLAFAYDSSGNLETSTNGLGQVTAFGNYDANGRPGTMTDPNGAVTAFTYDALGRTRTITARHPTNSALDAVTTLDYDARGQVVGMTLPATDKLFIDYDGAGLVKSLRAASGERIDYQADAQGNVTRETVQRSDTTIARRVSRTFDELGRTLSETLVAPNTSRFAYDKVGNVTQAKAPNGNATGQAFDALDRLVTTVAPDSGNSTTGYDSNDNVASFTDPKSVTTQFVRNGFGQVIQEVSPDRGTSTYYYNAAGELAASIDGRGQRVDYERDALGRVTRKTPVGRPSSEVIAYTWDTPGITGSYGVGRLASVADATGTTSFAYDHRGNLVTKRQTIGSGSADLGYAYDLADRVTQISYPSGRLVYYGYDSKGRVSQVQTKASASDPSWTLLASGLTYEPFGSVKSMSLGNGLSVANDWGDDGRLASRRLYATSSGTSLSWLAYTYDANDNVGAIRDKLDDSKSQYFGYDAMDRLTLTSSLLSAAPAAETYGYTSGTNRLATITTAAGTRSITYDGRGNTLGESRPGGGSVTTSYDGYGRLLSYVRTGDPAQANAYNGLDDRVSAASGSTTHAFVYDADGRVLGEYGASSADVVGETVWLQPELSSGDRIFTGGDGVGGYAPLAVATVPSSTPTLTWLHGNKLGVPVAFTDASGTAVPPPNYSLPGFPGQVRTLSDTYYNRYRDYDSSTGRYMQADPIGLDGGSNPYLYARANPGKYVDPDGLVPVIPIAIGFCAINPEVCVGIGAASGIALYNWYHGPNAPPFPQKPAIPDACPDDLCEQLALAEAKGGEGRIIMTGLADEPRLVAHYGRGPWVKKQHKRTCPGGRTLTIHYFSNNRGLNVELKFK